MTHGEEAAGAVYVQNVGQGDAGPFHVDFAGSCVGDSFRDPPREISGLTAGAEVYIHLTFTFAGTGTCEVSVEIDPANTLPETDETNNDVTVAITSQ